MAFFYICTLMKNFIFLIFLFICASACTNAPTQKEEEEMEAVDALIKQDNQRQDSAKQVLDSIYKP